VFDWHAIYERHSNAVWKSAWRILRHDESAADCVQETFLAAMGLAKTQPIRDWEKLLVSIAVRRALDELRRRCRARHRESAIRQQELRSTVLPPEEIVAAAELANRLRELLAQLPPHQAEVFCLRVFHALSYQEIATELDLDEQHVGVLLHRAKRSLQRQLDDSQAVNPLESPHA